MVVCLDTSGFIYLLISTIATNITGTFFLSTVLIAFFFMAVAGLFGIPIEITAILLLPLHLGFLACFGSDWLAVTGLLLIYLGILLGKNFFFRS